MIDVTRTTTLLLAGLHEPGNRTVWEEFDRRYRPILEGLARHFGLPGADAADVAQETLLEFVRAYRAGRYNRERGRLRHWLTGIARNRIAQARRESARRANEVHGGDELDAIPELDEAQITRVWETERRQVLLRAALDELRRNTRARDKTIEAFELLALHQTPVIEVARRLQMSNHDVYLAKSRVAARLREILRRLEDAFEDDE